MRSMLACLVAGARPNVPTDARRLRQLASSLEAEYLDFLSVLAGARAVLPGSGGTQEETTTLGVPGLTPHDNTERPITTSHGTTRPIGSDPRLAAERIVDVLERELLPEQAAVPASGAGARA
jgi:UDP-N-acetylglucosamine 2-epimerase (non-hydrolysing)